MDIQEDSANLKEKIIDLIMATIEDIKAVIN
jgi:hypothetical protein